MDVICSIPGNGKPKLQGPVSANMLQTGGPGCTIGFTLTYSFGNMKAGKNKTQRPDHDENNQMMNEMEEF